MVIHHIIAAGTIDERIVAALRKKDKTQGALIEAVKSKSKIRYANPSEIQFIGGTV